MVTTTAARIAGIIDPSTERSSARAYAPIALGDRRIISSRSPERATPSRGGHAKPRDSHQSAELPKEEAGGPMRPKGVALGLHPSTRPPGPAIIAIAVSAAVSIGCAAPAHASKRVSSPAASRGGPSPSTWGALARPPSGAPASPSAAAAFASPPGTSAKARRADEFCCARAAEGRGAPRPAGSHHRRGEAPHSAPRRARPGARVGCADPGHQHHPHAGRHASGQPGRGGSRHQRGRLRLRLIRVRHVARQLLAPLRRRAHSTADPDARPRAGTRRRSSRGLARSAPQHLVAGNADTTSDWQHPTYYPRRATRCSRCTARRAAGAAARSRACRSACPTRRGRPAAATRT